MSLLLTALWGCADSPSAPSAAVPARIDVSPAQVILAAPGDSGSLVASLFDARGRQITSAPPTWASSDESIVTVDQRGGVVARASGSATITASSGNIDGRATVLVDPDTHAPVLRSISVDRASVNVAGQPALVTVTATLTDDRAGVQSALAQFQTPSGAAITSIVTLLRVEGTATDGRYRGFLTVPVASAVGTWSLSLVRSEDSAGNVGLLRKEDLDARGIDVRFEVVWGGGDA